MSNKSNQKDELVSLSDSQLNSSRARPQDWKVERIVPGHGQDGEPESDQKSKFKKRGLDVNHRVLKGEGGDGIFSREAGKRTKQ